MRCGPGTLAADVQTCRFSPADAESQGPWPCCFGAQGVHDGGGGVGGNFTAEPTKKIAKKLFKENYLDFCNTDGRSMLAYAAYVLGFSYVFSFAEDWW